MWKKEDPLKLDEVLEPKSTGYALFLLSKMRI